jgi:2-amino-4-hydroxy-6-hydroxymethyldihydropteridine diphosphokinase
MILVAMGSNLPGRFGSALGACKAAIAALERLPGLRLEAVSRWYQTAPEPVSDQPDYVNGAARLSGQAGPEALLRALQAIEADAGRTRSTPNAARVLDLDLIDLNGLIRGGPDPILPHPRATTRDFVLYPVRDVAPDWRDPVTLRPIDALIGCFAPPRLLDS